MISDNCFQLSIKPAYVFSNLSGIEMFMKAKKFKLARLLAKGVFKYIKEELPDYEHDFISVMVSMNAKYPDTAFNAIEEFKQQVFKDVLDTVCDCERSWGN